MTRPKCLKTCYSPVACAGWGYCGERNLDAGGMHNVTPTMQQDWLWIDLYGDKWGVFTVIGGRLDCSFESKEEAHAYIVETDNGYIEFDLRELGTVPD